MGTTFRGLCGTPTSVYAVGHAVADESGEVFLFSSLGGGTWQPLSSTNGANDYADCAVGSDGTLFIAARRYVIEVTAQGDKKQVDLETGGLLDQWNAIAVMGDEVIVVGDEKSLARRDSAGNWSIVLADPNFDAQSWTSITGVGTTQLIVGGLGADTLANIGALALVDATSVTALAEPFDFYISDVWQADAHTLFIVGEIHPLAMDITTQEVVYRATR
jgi:hypothetical protein